MSSTFVLSRMDVGCDRPYERRIIDAKSATVQYIIPIVILDTWNHKYLGYANSYSKIN